MSAPTVVDPQKTANETSHDCEAPAEGHIASSGGGSDVETYQNLFVTKLHRNTKDQDLLALFAPFGGKSATVMLDAKTGRSKGFGFVLFDTEAEGKRAHEAMHQKQITVAGASVQLSIFPSKHDAKNAIDPSPSLYVRNVPIAIPKEEVERLLEQFGSVAFCAMREEPDGLPVWVILVEYDCQQCADNALSHLRHNTNMFPGGPLPVIAKYAKAMDRKRSLTSRKRQNASKNCPFRNNNSNRYVAGASGSGAGPLSGNSYNSSGFGGDGSYGNSAGSESLSSMWAAQLSVSQHAAPVPQFVTTTTNPNGSTTTTAYFGDGSNITMPSAAAAHGIHNAMMFGNPAGQGFGAPPTHSHMGMGPQSQQHGNGGAGGGMGVVGDSVMNAYMQQLRASSLGGQGSVNASIANPSTMFVFQPNAGQPSMLSNSGMGMGMPQPQLSAQQGMPNPGAGGYGLQMGQHQQHQHQQFLPQQAMMGQMMGGMNPPNMFGNGGMMMPPNASQFVTFPHQQQNGQNY